MGLAVSDDEARVAVPMRTLRRSNDRDLIAEIGRLASEEEVGALVVGEPRTLQGEVGDAAKRVRSFVTKLEAALHLPVHLIDEALTTAEAESRLREAGVPVRKWPEKRDALAAQILLQEWLDRGSRSC